MWIFIKGWYYNLDNIVKLSFLDNQLRFKEADSKDITIVYDLDSEEMNKIKNIINGRDN
jgi:hypothetical protein